MISTFVFVGRPGSGKGTQAKQLAEKRDFAYFATGDWFRARAKEESPLGALVRDTINSGKLMPHWFASYIVQDFVLNQSLEQTLILDGSNRTLPEAKQFDEYMKWLGRDYRVLSLDVSADEITKRILGRGQDSGRADDTEVAIRTRIDEYDLHTKEAVNYLESTGAVIHINGERPIEEISLDIEQLVKELQS